MQYIPCGKQYIDEDDYLGTAIRLVATGPRVADFVGAKYAVALSSETAALHAVYFAPGVGLEIKT